MFWWRVWINFNWQRRISYILYIAFVYSVLLYLSFSVLCYFTNLLFHLVLGKYCIFTKLHLWNIVRYLLLASLLPPRYKSNSWILMIRVCFMINVESHSLKYRKSDKATNVSPGNLQCSRDKAWKARFFSLNVLYKWGTWEVWNLFQSSQLLMN